MATNTTDESTMQRSTPMYTGSLHKSSEGRMGAQQVVVNEQPMDVLEWDGKRVVTYDQIARVHGVSRASVEKSYRNHSNRFVDGEDTYLLDFT